MTTASVGRTRAAERQLQWALIAALLAVATVSWVLSEVRMTGMAHGPTTDVGPAGAFMVSWVLMMAAMMLPSAAPIVLAHARIGAGRAGHRAPGAGAALVGGYLAAWAAYGLGAYTVLAVAVGVLPDVGWDDGGRAIAATAIVAAGVYQVTPAKQRCLSRCRSPFAFLLDEWRDGRLGAFVMGARHGGWCVGCCWGLMVALFALGVMSLGWMAFVAGVVAAEKLLPRPRVVAPSVALLLILLGLLVAIAPGIVPGVPGAGGGPHPMP